MRLTQEEIEAIRSAVRTHFGEDARVLLFGSRTDDSKRGGDIDLLVECSLNARRANHAKLNALTDIQRRIGERKIDMVPATAQGDTREIVSRARTEGVPL